MLEVVVIASTGYKCPRCWCYHHMEFNYGHTPDEIELDRLEYLTKERKKFVQPLSNEKLCDNCQQVIIKNFPDHEATPHIIAAIEYQNKLWIK